MNKKYREYLKSDDWKRRRNARLNVTGCRCEICHTQSPSNDVHHVKYRRDLQTVRTKELRVLCRMCHIATHRAVDILKDRGLFTKISPKKIWKQTIDTIKGEKLLPESVLESMDYAVSGAKKPRNVPSEKRMRQLKLKKEAKRLAKFAKPIR